MNNGPGRTIAATRESPSDDARGSGDGSRPSGLAVVGHWQSSHPQPGIPAAGTRFDASPFDVGRRHWQHGREHVPATLPQQQTCRAGVSGAAGPTPETGLASGSEAQQQVTPGSGQDAARVEIAVSQTTTLNRILDRRTIHPL
jgi:hypothetical protein